MTHKLEEKSIEKGEESDSDQQLYQQLHGEFKVMCDLVFSKFNKRFDMLSSKMDNIIVLVKEIKQDVHKIVDGLKKAEIKILENCSTRLLAQVLLQDDVPAYPYLTSSDGKMEKLKKVLVGERATIHFLCECLEEGPHEVEGQVGKKVAVEKGVLMKMAPFLARTLIVLCCAARLAASVYLPGVAPAFFSPLLDCLKSIGITEQALQSEIMPEALNALFDELGIESQKLYDRNSAMLNVDHNQREEGVKALKEFLGSIENLDMGKDFGLYLVQGRDQKAHWHCEKHARGHKRLPHPQNPFSHLVK